jgi:hypothetical protein
LVTVQPVPPTQLPVAQAFVAAPQSVELLMLPAPSHTTYELPTQVLVPGVHALQASVVGVQPYGQTIDVVTKPSVLQATRLAPWHSVVDGVHSLHTLGTTTVLHPYEHGEEEIVLPTASHCTSSGPWHSVVAGVQSLQTGAPPAPAVLQP